MAVIKQDKKHAKNEPLRLSLSAAAVQCDVNVKTLRNEIARNIFTIIAPRGRGRGKPIFLFPDEVSAYAFGGPDAVRQVRHKAKRLK